MTKYVVKVTYLEGNHKGESYFLNKGGFVIPNLEYVWQDSSYTERACKAACTRLKKNNDLNRRLELQDRARMIENGRAVSPYMIYWLASYEPFAIETVDA